MDRPNLSEIETGEIETHPLDSESNDSMLLIFLFINNITHSYMLVSLHNSRQVLITFMCTIAIWLYLHCGLSHANIDHLMKVIHLLIALAINFGCLLLQIQHCDLARLTPPPIPPILHDVHTAITKLSLDPKIIRSICCPQCYSKYSLDHLPEICSWQKTARSQPCGARLWTTRSTPSGPHYVPCRLYSSQDFVSWLEFFLSQ
jgi:hypothetical protein